MAWYGLESRNHVLLFCAQVWHGMTALSIWNKGRMHGKTLWHEMNYTAVQLPGASHAALRNGSDLQAHQDTSPSRGVVKDLVTRRMMTNETCTLVSSRESSLISFFPWLQSSRTSDKTQMAGTISKENPTQLLECDWWVWLIWSHGFSPLRFTCPAFWNLIWLCLRNKDWQEQFWKSSLRWQYPWYPLVPYLCRTSWCDTAPSLLYMKKIIYLESRSCIDCEQVKVVPTLTGQGEAMMRALWPQKRRIHTIHTWFKS